MRYNKYELDRTLVYLKGYPHLSNYFERLITNNPLPVSQLLIDDYLDLPLKWDGDLRPANKFVLDEIIRMEEEKFSLIRDERMNINVSDVLNYFRNNLVLGFTVGLPGAGKTTFVTKHFMKEEYSNYDDESAYSLLFGSDADNEINSQIKNALGNKNSFIIDSLYTTKALRTDLINQASYYGASTLCFLFDSHVPTCFERINKRYNSGGVLQVHNLTDIIKFLAPFELPLNNDLLPETGIDLVIVVSTNGELINAYPFKKL